ncbi:MAG: DEAD/DEAH box helicase [Symploca sp. SIO1C4]|uniref:DEAD/DEAH box helicase n=1 Tax=Symploca sp. SIO1C4 TaxID=2607765 RepID=A0A6B3N9Z6_9CYAN|nr:DEAD/DEAH box helicase [Symploca sp. SIO1C4]
MKAEESKPQRLHQLILRDYQKQVIAEIYAKYRHGFKSVMLYAPTGAGKTVIAAQIIADSVSRGRRVLFVCHRTKLVSQTAATLERLFGISSGIIWAGAQTDYTLPVQIAMLQSIAKRELPPDMGLVIFDECHSSVYFAAAQRMINHYSGGILALSECFFLGLTASPWRTKSKQGYCWLFGQQGLVRAPAPRELIKMGHLAKARHFGYQGLIDYTQLDTDRNGDYTKTSMKRVCNEEFNAEIVKIFRDFCPSRQTIAFCATVWQAWDLAAQFNEVGIISEVVVGSTSEQEREAIYARFRTGETQLISSVGCLCEGFDEPCANAAIIARPTKSKALLIQMLGRALRLHPGKEDAYLLDFCENFHRLNILATSSIKINLCPREWEPPEELKNCPRCQAMIPKFARVCPECGYIFEGEGEEEPLGEDLPFGEILSPEEEQQCKYLRAQRKYGFTIKRNPYKATWLFFEKFDFFPPDRWLKHACLRDEHKLPELAKYRFLAYLNQVRPDAPQVWINQRVAEEFGYYQDGERHIPWWEYMGVESSATWVEIVSRYREIYDFYENSNASSERFQLLGLAFDEAREFGNFSRKRPRDQL